MQDTTYRKKKEYRTRWKWQNFYKISVISLERKQTKTYVTHFYFLTKVAHKACKNIKCM